MTRPKVLALVLAGGAGGRMEVLTTARAKPALPYAGVYRLIDIALSNIRNSGIADAWIVVQYEAQSIISAVASGRPWDLDRTHGGLQIVPPRQEGIEAEGVWHEGNADAIYQNRELIRAFDPDVLLILSADHIYKLDYNDVIDQHLASGADATLVTTEVPIDQASNHGTVTVGKRGEVTGFAYKPKNPESNVVTTEIFVYTPDVVIETLEKLSSRNRTEDASGSGLEDFGHDLLPELVRTGTVRDFRLPGYWKDVGRPETYFESHMQLLEDYPDLDLDDPAWPIFTLNPQRMPARIHGTARIDHSLVSPGCDIAGTVERSVLSPGVVVERGATVRDAIILQDVTVRTGATVQCAIVDGGAVIDERAEVGQKPEDALPTTEELVLIGGNAMIAKEATIKRGQRIEPNAHVPRAK
ncbi:MAG: NTP transferase domain-containing protein [Chloroflexia bacterium]|nr:NTP transferase domain-containing protein [Chloroflexia bacterium]